MEKPHFEAQFGQTKKTKGDPRTVDRSQVIFGGSEIAKVFNELNRNVAPAFWRERVFERLRHSR